MCNILTFVDWWVKWKIGSWSLEIWLKNTLDRDLPMMKLLLLFNEFFLYLNAFHRNLNFLEQTCTFLHLLKQLSSLSYVCFIRHRIFIMPWLFYFAVAFLICRGFFVLPQQFLFCCGFFGLPWLFYFAVPFLFCRGFFGLPWLFGFAAAFSFCHGSFNLPWIFKFCGGLFGLPWLFYFAVPFLFFRSFLVLPWHLWATVKFPKTPSLPAKQKSLRQNKKATAKQK